MAKLSVDQTLSKAKSHMKRGELAPAQGLYQAILEVFPENRRAREGLTALNKMMSIAGKKGSLQEVINHLLILYDEGQLEAVADQALAATEQHPDAFFIWNILGAANKGLGRIKEALYAFKKVILINPTYADGHNNLGITLQDFGMHKEALKSFKTALSLKPDYAEAHNNMGLATQALGNFDIAIRSLTQALYLKPNYAEAHNNMGLALQAKGNFSEAVKSHFNALSLRPDYIEAHNNLGNAHRGQHKPEEAIHAYNEALSLKPNFAEAHNNKGIALQTLGRLEEAEASYKQAIALKPNFAGAYYNLGIIFQEQGRSAEAEASYTEAIRLEPDYAEAHNNLGAALQEIGRLDEAEASYMRALALKPDYAEAHRNLAITKKFDAKDEQYSKMLELYLDENISAEQRCHINFGLAKACEDFEDFGQALSHYNEGNCLRKQLLDYDISQDVDLFGAIKCAYPKLKQNSLEPNNFLMDLRPVFIIGMPRSGTTLVEQIISASPQVTGAGELNYISQFGRQLATGSSQINSSSLLEFREIYLQKLKSVSMGKSIVTDKMPQNFRFIGLVAAAFPEAKIVHVKRNPAAVCWSNYTKYFPSNDLGYSYALEDVVSYYSLYENLMEFWANSLEDRIYNLDYELLTVNQESETRRLIDYLGWDWNETHLSPQDNTRRVKTASNTQIRKKVYQGSSEQWKKYEPFLNGALDDLL